MSTNNSISIVFMGTPDFAVASLEAICDNDINVVGVITAPDKPAGRGKKIQSSAVKKYAVKNNIGPILQPANLKDVKFQSDLKDLEADLFVVVAFRMLPESIWSMPGLGTINLHASLLPNYRGAAPINWAVINGEKKSGVTTFFIEKEIDTGKIIRQEEVKIESTDSAGTLHDKLMKTGAHLLVQTIKNIEAGCYEVIHQDVLAKSELISAPKIFKEDCRINWNKPVKDVYNLIRGLSPYPAAYTEFTDGENTALSFKIFESSIADTEGKPKKPGEIIYQGTKQIMIGCSDGYIEVHSLQQAGKKRIDTESFLRGFTNKEKYILAT